MIEAEQANIETVDERAIRKWLHQPECESFLQAIACEQSFAEVQALRELRKHHWKVLVENGAPEKAIEYLARAHTLGEVVSLLREKSKDNSEILTITLSSDA